MFVRKKRVRRNSLTDYYQLVESVRVDGKPRQRVVLYLGRYGSVGDALEFLPRDLRTARSRLIRFKKGHDQRLVDSTQVYVDQLAERLEKLRRIVQEHPELIETP